MTYEDYVFDACDDIGGHHFGGKFVSRTAIKTWIKVNRDIDCTNGVSKSALKRTLSKEGLWEKKGDSYRITKDFREKKKAKKFAAEKREKNAGTAEKKTVVTKKSAAVTKVAKKVKGKKVIKQAPAKKAVGKKAVKGKKK